MWPEDKELLEMCDKLKFHSDIYPDLKEQREIYIHFLLTHQRLFRKKPKFDYCVRSELLNEHFLRWIISRQQRIRAAALIINKYMEKE